MAERLTEKDSIDNKRYMLNSEENQITLTNAKLNNGFRKAYYWGKALDKLSQLEDIMEKYGIESVEELDKKIGHYIDKIDLEAENDYLKKAIEKQNMISKIISKNRDTWQKACELACEREDDCYVYDNIHRAYEFYQQAKKKGEQK